MIDKSVASSERRLALDLFLVGFLVLFLELACIRWFAAYVIFLQFFTNVVLMASFLGMSCGCLAARSRRDWLPWFPTVALFSMFAALIIFGLYFIWRDQLVVQVDSPQEVFFGTEYRNPDIAQFVIPLDLIAGSFFVLVALMFVGVGQVLGRAFDAYPDRVKAYTYNIGGSLAGIVAFSALSFLEVRPVIWFAIAFLLIGDMLRREGQLSLVRIMALVTVLGAVLVSGAVMEWSPYYAIRYDRPSGNIIVNTIAHQQMTAFADRGSNYSIIELLRKHSGGAPFEDALVIGAGSGNDIAHALRFDVARVDAVEIDPVIQEIGIAEHPDRPYQDPRTVPHLDDGRHYLRTTDRKYDLVVYALVDSLILHSSYANIRLESYLFTEEAFADVKRVLKPGGVFVMYNFYRQGWIVERVSAMAERVFGCKPLLISLPYRATLAPDEPTGFTVVIAGCDPAIAAAFRAHPSFWLNRSPPLNLGVDGFAIDPAGMAPAEREAWERIAPTTLVRASAQPLLTSDDWPFLYLRGRLIPDLSLRSIAVLGVLGIGMVYLFMPKGGTRRIHGRMFFLGAGFMLLETKAVVQLALLFGSTWLVNSLVFFTVLVLILCANLYVLRVSARDIAWHYGGLLVLLGLGVLVPLDAFLGGGIVWRYVLPCALALGPMYFAGVIFARSFAGIAAPDFAFGSNIAGSVVGGLSESLSTLLGFRYLLLVALAFYLLSAAFNSGPAARR